MAQLLSQSGAEGETMQVENRSSPLTDRQASPGTQNASTSGVRDDAFQA
jgi:hypothetical protein